MLVSVCVCREKHRSLLGIPMLRPDSSIIHVWTGVITFVDLTYTAFLVPLSIAFDDIVQGTSLSWLTITDIVGSACSIPFFVYVAYKC